MERNIILASNKGNLELLKIPKPQIDKNEVLIEVFYSVVSTGTETTIRKTTEPGSIVRAAFNKLSEVKEMGLKKSLLRFKKVWGSYQPLGYSLLGKVVAIGDYVTSIEKGDFVVATGAGSAIHAKYTAVPAIYVQKIAEPSPYLAFSGVMTIAVNAYAKVKPMVTDRVAVVGGGLIGMLSADVFNYGGCNVTIIDINEKVLERLAANNYQVASQFSGEYDHIIICTDTDEIMEKVQNHVKYRGNIVITGYGKIELDRDLIENKQFQIFCTNAYGEFANNQYYNLLSEDTLSSQYGLCTARDSLKRASVILAKQPFKDYQNIYPENCSGITKLLEDKAVATVLLDWTKYE